MVESDICVQANTNLEAYRTQLAGFMAVVEERRHLPALKQFLKLYSVSAAAAVACVGGR